MNFDLPPMQGTASAAFVTAAEGKRWLGDLALANPATLHQHLCEQIELLNQQAISLQERFGILEMLRQHVAFVQEEMSKRFAGKALPYNALEARAFAATTMLWRAVVVGYLRCLEDASVSNQPEPTPAVLVERALSTLHAAHLDRVRGYAQPESQHWERLHKLLAFAVERELATAIVKDKLRNGEQAVTPLSVYGESILLHAASAYEFPARHQEWVVRWVRRWSGKLLLRVEPPAELQAIPLSIDLASSLPPSPIPVRAAIDAGSARYLDTTELANSIKTRLAALAAGRSPAELQLGSDCTQPACEQVLQRLYQRWCRGGMQRPTERQVASGTVTMAVGSEGIWFHISGNPFRQPRAADGDNLLRLEREELATFGHVSKRHNLSMLDMNKLRADESWQLVNEGIGGLRLMRSAMTEDSIRIGIGQLVAIKKPGGAGFALGSVRWLMINDEGHLHAGFQLLPGNVQGIAIRNAGLNAANDAWRPAYLLINEQSERQLVLPSGVYRADRIIDVAGHPPCQYKLGSLIERGDDFERVALA